MTLRQITIGCLLATALFLSGCGGGDNNNETPSTQGGSTPSSSNVLGTTTITSTAGETIQVDMIQNGFIFHGYENKIVLLEVYGDTCPHCIEAIDSYNRLQAKYSNDVVVIALESYGSLTNAGRQQYITIPMQNTGNMFAFIRELTGYNREAVPFLMVFSRDGNKVYQNILATFPENEIDGLIQQLL